MKSKTHSTPDTAPDATPDTTLVQGEGDYKSAKRYNESVKTFVKKGQVTQAAEDAAPATPEEAQEMERAETEGLSHSKGEDPGDDRQGGAANPETIDPHTRASTIVPRRASPQK